MGRKKKFHDEKLVEMLIIMELIEMITEAMKLAAKLLAG